MTHHHKTHNLFSVTGPAMPIHFMAQSEDVRCFHCSRVTRIAVRTEYIDWKIVADDYKLCAEKMQLGLTRIMNDLEAMYGDENPAAVYFRNETAELMGAIRKRMADLE